MIILTTDGKPFLGDDNLAVAQVSLAVETGCWDKKELADRGLVLAEPFVIPAGKIIIGEAFYTQQSDKTWAQQYDVVDAPIKILPTPQEQFESVTGITIDQLKELLK